jgi:hypothetical protein
MCGFSAVSAPDKANFRGDNLFIARKFNDEWRGNRRKDVRKALRQQVLNPTSPRGVFKPLRKKA